VAEEQPERGDHDAVVFRCRIVIEVPIRVREITRESAAEEFTPSDELSWAWVESQARLLRVLLSDGEALNRYLISVAKDDLGALLQSDWIEGLPADEEDELFEGLYSMLEEEDADFFHWAQRMGVLYENMRLIHQSFITNWKGAELKELYLIPAPDRKI
jgi:hypothetical protein